MRGTTPIIARSRLTTRFSAAAVCGLLVFLGASPPRLSALSIEEWPAFATAPIQETGLGRDDYLPLIAGIVNYFLHFQQPDGRIIDPFERREIQYSTPCFAWAAAALVAGGRHPELLEPAAAALDAALKQLFDGKTADDHGDFFTFPAVLAYEQLRGRVAPERRERWEKWLRGIVPSSAYRDVLTETRESVHNWNVAALAGEFLRSQNGLTDLAFVERHLQAQLAHFTADGLYRDPDEPMAYDHFPRHFLAAMLHRGYAGDHRKQLDELLDRAAWTSLLIQSPLGELASGGRGSQHQWNEAQQCVTFEIWAARKQKEGDLTAAHAFKRAAHLSLQSIQRWVRPSGELWIVKNRFDPALRHGYEADSFHSQCNLLAASMLATAWHFADDGIAEGPCPADVGGFVIHLPEFRQVIANCGGFYLQINTLADRRHNSSGLQRVHRAGIDGLVGPGDSLPASENPLAVGLAWHDGERWQSLGSLAPQEIQNVAVTVARQTPQRVQFSIRYEIVSIDESDPIVRAVVENYDLIPTQVRVTAEVFGDNRTTAVLFPAMAFDGQQAARITVDGMLVTVRLGASRQAFLFEQPANIRVRRTGQWMPSRNGYVELIEAQTASRRIVYRLRPEHVRAVE